MDSFNRVLLVAELYNTAGYGVAMTLFACNMLSKPNKL